MDEINEPSHYLRLVKKHLVDETEISDSLEAEVTFEEADVIIVLLDALGIKGIWNRKNPTEVLQEEYAKGIESLRNEFSAH